MFHCRTSIDFGQCSQGLSVTLLIKSEVPFECFFDDPASRTLKACGKAVELAGELVRDVCGYNSIAHR